jgi:hypothetical protein
MARVLLLNEIDTEETTGWWLENRLKINEVIEAFNNWQIDGFDLHRRDVVEAMITRARRFSNERGDRCFSDWQLETLDEMQAHIDQNKKED